MAAAGGVEIWGLLDRARKCVEDRNSWLARHYVNLAEGGGIHALDTANHLYGIEVEFVYDYDGR